MSKTSQALYLLSENQGDIVLAEPLEMPYVVFVQMVLGKLTRNL